MISRLYDHGNERLNKEFDNMTEGINKIELAEDETLPVLQGRQVVEPTIGEMMAQLIQSGNAAENVGVLKELIALKRDEQLWNAKQAFTRAYHAMKAELPRIQAMKPVPNNDGTTRYKYAPLSDLTEIVEPYLFKYGFTVADDTEVDADGKRVTNICILTHKDGHSERFRYAVRIGNGPPKATESQADGAAYSYAKRGAYCNALGIRIERDDDARGEGDTITPDQAVALQVRVENTGTDKARFLAFAGSKTYEGITTSKYPILDAMLKKKEGV